MEVNYTLIRLQLKNEKLLETRMLFEFPLWSVIPSVAKGFFFYQFLWKILLGLICVKICFSLLKQILIKAHLTYKGQDWAHIHITWRLLSIVGCLCLLFSSHLHYLWNKRLNLNLSLQDYCDHCLKNPSYYISYPFDVG